MHREIISGEISYKDLPPRVVIHEIISFKFTRLLESFSDIELFGYFKRDRSRHIWFVFPSVEIIGRKDVRINCCLNFCKISSLFIQNPSFALTMKISSVTKDMYSLQDLKVVENSDEEHHGLRLWDSILLDEDEKTFPNLKILVFESKFMNGSSWSILKHPFKALRKLNLTMLSFSNQSFFSETDSKSITHLRLQNIKMKEVVKARFSLLRKLWLDNVENIVIIPGSVLRSLKIIKVHSKLVKDICQRSKNIDLLRMSEILFNRTNPSSWVLNRDINPMKHLKRLSLQKFTMDERIVNELSRLKDQLEMLHLRSCPDLNEEPFLIDYSKLHAIRIDHSNAIRGDIFKWEVSKNIKRIVFISLINLSDELFIMNEWNSLERMDIWSCQKLTGRGWNHLPKLNRIEFYFCRKFGDHFFQEQDLSKVENISIDSVFSITGKNWKNCFSNLKVLHFEACFDLEDLVFQNIDFPLLETLRLDRLPKMFGRGWKEFLSLKKIVASSVQKSLESKVKEYESRNVSVKFSKEHPNEY